MKRNDGAFTGGAMKIGRGDEVGREINWGRGDEVGRGEELRGWICDTIARE